MAVGVLHGGAGRRDEVARLSRHEKGTARLLGILGRGLHRDHRRLARKSRGSRRDSVPMYQTNGFLVQRERVGS